MPVRYGMDAILVGNVERDVEICARVLRGAAETDMQRRLGNIVDLVALPLQVGVGGGGVAVDQN
jgi:hypothetical protein